MQGRVIKERYRLLEQLGQGGMGSVWRAEDLTLHIDVAVKLIDPNFAESEEARARFEREALAAAQLRSMHIVLITEQGVDLDTPYIVMELLRGQSLAARLRQQLKLSFEQTLEIFSQIAEALAFAHERRIVHRDLKPDNVFIVSERTKELVKVLDFGVAKRLDAQSFGNKIKTHTGTLLGTPYYMSPEQTRGSADVDHRSDIWSFGVMAYECVTGKRPFEADTLPDLLMAICRDPFQPPSQVAAVPAGFDDWFSQMAEREVSQRFQSVEAAMVALSALRGNELVGGRLQQESVPSAFGGTIRVPPHSPSPAGEAPVVEGATALSSNTVTPSSVTSPGKSKARARRATLGWLGSAFVVLGAILGYWLWPASNHAVAESVSADSTQQNAAAPPIAEPAAAPAVSAAPAPSAVAKPDVVPVVALPESPKPSSSAKPKPSPPARAPTSAAVTRPGTKPKFRGGF